MGYARGQAVCYAAAYWDKVCDDGYVATLGQPGYVQQTAAASLLGLSIPHEEDCTHFVSRCLGRLGGGLSIPNGSYLPRGILSAPALVYYLGKKSGLAVQIIEKTPKQDAWDYIDCLAPGDVIAYFPITGKDYGHTVLYIGDGRIACHSISRWGEYFDAPAGNSLVTFLHIK